MPFAGSDLAINLRDRKILTKARNKDITVYLSF